MQVSIKSFDVEMNVKSSGIEFAVCNTQGAFQGDCFLTMSGLVWCKGKTKKENGERIAWADFIALMESPEILKSAIKQAKKSKTSSTEE